MKHPCLAQTLGAFLSAALLAAPAVAQENPVRPTDAAAMKAQERLPEDAPRVTSPQTALTTGSSPSSSAAAQSSAAQPSEAEMMQMMMENMKLNENHKLLAEVAGTWDHTVRFWMDPSAPPAESKGTTVRKAMMDGRYFTTEATGKMQMPGPDGKMQDFDFKGHGLEGYDNAKKKFVSTWCDNMGTGVMMLEGTYDPGAKTFTYAGEYQMAPTMKQKVRSTVRVLDKDRHLFEWFEERGGQEVKTMEIAYTRKK